MEVDQLKAGEDLEVIFNLFRFILKTQKFQRLIIDFKFKSAEECFNKADFNYELLKISIDKVIEEQKMKKEIEKQLEDENKINKWKNKFDLSNLFSFKNKSSLYIISSILVFISFLIVIVNYLLFANSSNTQSKIETNFKFKKENQCGLK